MNIIVISNPVNIPGEVEAIHRLFALGLETFHLRKPNFTEDEMEQFLRALNPLYYRKIVIHSHYKLINRYNLKGIHLTSSAVRSMDNWAINEIKNVVKQRKLTLSASFHNLQELQETTITYDYVFLSPIFDSISKKNYPSQIDLKQASDFLLHNKKGLKVIALGGIDVGNISILREVGFDGIALLGAIWNSEDPDNKFKLIKSKYLAYES
jgi:thiamine-phosphate pyrophosphorylase